MKYMTANLLFLLISAIAASYGLDVVRVGYLEGRRLQGATSLSVSEDIELEISGVFAPRNFIPRKTMFFWLALTMPSFWILSQVTSRYSELFIVFTIVVAFVTMIQSVIDFIVFRLPNSLTLFLIVAVAALVFAYSREAESPVLMLAIVGAVFYTLIWFLPALLGGASVIGMGDAKIAIALGAIISLGSTNILEVIVACLYAAVISSFVGGIAGIFMRKLNLIGSQFPFGPFLILGTWTIFLLSFSGAH